MYQKNNISASLYSNMKNRFSKTSAGLNFETFQKLFIESIEEGFDRAIKNKPKTKFSLMSLFSCFVRSNG
jgi:hypothetical protein